jgi:hypothetical protein
LVVYARKVLATLKDAEDAMAACGASRPAD